MRYALLLALSVLAGCGSNYPELELAPVGVWVGGGPMPAGAYVDGANVSGEVTVVMRLFVEAPVHSRQTFVWEATVAGWAVYSRPNQPDSTVAFDAVHEWSGAWTYAADTLRLQHPSGHVGGALGLSGPTAHGTLHLITETGESVLPAQGAVTLRRD